MVALLFRSEVLDQLGGGNLGDGEMPSEVEVGKLFLEDLQSSLRPKEIGRVYKPHYVPVINYVHWTASS